MTTPPDKSLQPPPDSVSPRRDSAARSTSFDPAWLSYRKVFARLFLIAFAVQLALYGLFVQFGIDRATSGITVFGQVCLTFYYPVFVVMSFLPQSMIGTGLSAIGLLFWLAPAVGTVIYSAILALVVLFFRRVRLTL